MRAIIKNHKEIVEMLISKGANLSLKDLEGNTALHYACYEEKIDIAIMLANAGADYKVENNQNKNPLESGPVDLGLKLYSLKHGEINMKFD